MNLLIVITTLVINYLLPFGAQVRYFIESGDRTILGCLQFSSPAWRMPPRDKWITWDDEQRKRNLQKIVNNSRFLLLPWVKIKNLASSVLSLACRQIQEDWQRCYCYRPVLMETLVKTGNFKGTCYKTANWIHVSTTMGGGEWIVIETVRIWRLRRFIYIPLPDDFEKSFWHRRVGWDLHLFLIPGLIIRNNFDKCCISHYLDCAGWNPA